jgi:putative tricarboxylic transport membrane protein
MNPLFEPVLLQTSEILRVGASLLTDPFLLLLTFVAVCIGISVGTIPGMNASVGVAILLPLAFGFDPVTAILFFFGVYSGAQFGGSIAAILINTPGTTAAAATTFDGYPMTKAGMAGIALGAATVSSVIGGLFSVIVLTYFAPPFASIALEFGPSELAAFAIFGLSLVSAISGENISKGVVAAMFGLFIATIGTDPFSGSIRLTFGIDFFQGGVNFIAALIGLFAVAEIITNVRTIREDVEDFSGQVGSVIPSWETMRQIGPVTVLGCIVGTIAGLLPGSGSTLGSFINYGLAERLNRDTEDFGNGDVRGVAASESANNASTGGAMIPLLTLGIPGSGTTAVMLGALSIINITPGPRLFQNTELIYQWFSGFFMANIMLLIAALAALPLFIKTLELPRNVLFGAITILVAIGGYSIANSFRTAWIMFGMGVIGYILKEFDFPLGPVVLAVVLEPIIEKSVRQATAIHQGELMPIISRPIVSILLILSVITFLSPYIGQYLSDEPAVTDPDVGG